VRALTEELMLHVLQLRPLTLLMDNVVHLMEVLSLLLLLQGYVIQAILHQYMVQVHGIGIVVVLMEEQQLIVLLTSLLTQSTEDVDLLMEEHILLLLPGDYVQQE